MTKINIWELKILIYPFQLKNIIFQQGVLIQII